MTARVDMAVARAYVFSGRSRRQATMHRVQSSAREPPAINALIVELLAWVAARPRTYGETMEAWRTSCPRMPVWEDATSAGLIEVLPSGGAGMSAAPVRLTPSGRAVLAGATERSGAPP